VSFGVEINSCAYRDLADFGVPKEWTVFNCARLRRQKCAQSRAQNQELFFGRVSHIKSRRDTCLNETLAFADCKQSE
jgi:hypothetical protein